MMARQRIIGALLTVAATIAATTARAQTTWPDKPIRVIVPFAAGGFTDTVTRTLQPRLVEALGQPLLVENRPGAGGTVGEAVVAKAPPDGYTILMSVDSVPANPHLFAKLSYDLFRDLVPITMVARVPLVLIVHPSVPATSLPELISYVRTRGGAFAYASPGTATNSHLYTELFRSLANVEMTHVPYKGGGPAMTDLIGGQVQAILISVTLSAPQVKAGKARALAVASEKRFALLPNVPTFAESGYTDFTPHTWTGLLVPTGTPAAIQQRLHAEFVKAARAPEVQARFRDLSAELVMNSPAEFSAFLRTEYDRLGKLIKERRISGD